MLHVDGHLTVVVSGDAEVFSQQLTVTVELVGSGAVNGIPFGDHMAFAHVVETDFGDHIGDFKREFGGQGQAHPTLVRVNGNRVDTISKPSHITRSEAIIMFAIHHKVISDLGAFPSDGHLIAFESVIKVGYGGTNRERITHHIRIASIHGMHRHANRIIAWLNLQIDIAVGSLHGLILKVNNIIICIGNRIPGKTDRSVVDHGLIVHFLDGLA